MKTILIDLHTHLLPYMDDGAKDLKEALKLTEQLWEQGVGGAACTSHFDPARERIEDFVKRRDNAIKLMYESKIELYPASETYLHEFLLYYDSISPLCIANSNYLLIELPFTKLWGSELYALIKKLMIRYDIIPIIAHAERYPASNIGNIRKLKNLGCVIQLNSSSLLKKKYKRKMVKYMKKGLADLIGSDCHDLIKRPPRLSIAYDLLESIVGGQYCQQLMLNAQSTIQGNDIRLNTNNTTRRRRI